MHAREGNLQQTPWDQKGDHQPGYVARGQQKEAPSGEEDPVICLEANTGISQSAVESTSDEDGRDEKELP